MRIKYKTKHIFFLFLLFSFPLMGIGPQVTLNFINESGIGVKVFVRELFNEHLDEQGQIAYESQVLKEIDLTMSEIATATFFLLDSHLVGKNTAKRFLKANSRYLSIELVPSEGKSNWIPLRFGEVGPQTFLFTFKLRKSPIVEGRIEATELKH